MNIFEILREKLEKKKENCIHNQKNFEKCHLAETAIICEAMSKAFESAIEIVNQVEQEYNNDFCEWKFEETTGIVWHCDDKCTTYNLSYATNLRNIADDFECKCPYCGKKIKVVSND